MSDTFNWDYNPYRVGDMINICGIIYIINIQMEIKMAMI